MVAKERPEKFRPERDSNPDLCDASAVLYQLSYQANLELAIIWVNDKSVDSGDTYVIKLMKFHLNCGF